MLKAVDKKGQSLKVDINEKVIECKKLIEDQPKNKQINNTAVKTKH